jgi:hypothetical protein
MSWRPLGECRRRHLEPGHLIFVIDRHGSAPARRAFASPAFGLRHEAVGPELGGDLFAHWPREKS